MIKNTFPLAVASMLLFSACQNAETKTANSSAEITAAPQPTATETITPADAPAATTIQWIDSVINKGAVAEGEQLEIAFRFKNTGNSPLVIKDVRPSCGCTVAEKPEAPVAPGKEGVIKTKFDTKGRIGNNHKTIDVEANTEQGRYVIAFDVTVNKKS